MPHPFKEFRSPKLGLGTMGHSFFAGTAGLLLFFVELQAASPDAVPGDVVDRSLDALALAVSRLAALESAPGDLAEGAPGILYAASRSGRARAGDPRFTRLADRAFDLVAAFHPEGHERADVLTGVAGVVLALLAYHRFTGREEALRLAIAHGDELLRRAETPGPGRMAWRVSGRLLSGFAHGAGGIASTLARLHERSGREDLREAGTAAFRYELDLFDRRTGSWPDLRPRDEEGPAADGFMLGWCTGNPGVLLGLLDRPDAFPSGDVEEIVERGVEGIFENLPRIRRDHLCCGKPSGVEVLGEIARRTGRDEILDRTLRGAVHLVERSKAAGGYYLDDLCPRSERYTFPPVGLFEGLAGIGLTWLRLSQEDAGPSPLAFTA